jgi:hypothetical protein
MPLPPSLTDAQRREALAKAAEARKKRAELKEELRTGRTSLSELLDQTEQDVVGKMKVSQALEAMPGVGKVRAMRIMQRLSISATRRLRGLGDKQKEALLREFAQK